MTKLNLEITKLFSLFWDDLDIFNIRKKISKWLSKRYKKQRFCSK